MLSLLLLSLLLCLSNHQPIKIHQHTIPRPLLKQASMHQTPKKTSCPETPGVMFNENRLIVDDFFVYPFYRTGNSRHFPYIFILENKIEGKQTEKIIRWHETWCLININHHIILYQVALHLLVTRFYPKNEGSQFLFAYMEPKTKLVNLMDCRFYKNL